MKDSLLKVYYPVKDYLLIILGTALYGFGYNAFILSNEIVTGGLSGICGLIFFATKLPVSVSYFAINVVLLGIAFKILGFKFLIKTILGVASLSFWFWFFDLDFGDGALHSVFAHKSVRKAIPVCQVGAHPWGVKGVEGKEVEVDAFAMTHVERQSCAADEEEVLQRLVAHQLL